MNLYLRFLWLLITSRLKPPAMVPDITRLEFRVLPSDLDANLHMNNGRYATIMDLGRINLLQRVGLFRHVLSNKWMPIISDLQLEFLRPMKLFQKYSLETRLACWDDKWVYIEQVFNSNNKVIARGLVKAQIRRGREAVPVAEMLQLINYQGESPAPVEYYRTGNE